MNEVMIGAVSGVVASLIGAILTAWLSYRFQDRLLGKQQRFQEAQDKRQADLQKTLQQEQQRFLEEMAAIQQQQTESRDFRNRRSP